MRLANVHFMSITLSRPRGSSVITNNAALVSQTFPICEIARTAFERTTRNVELFGSHDALFVVDDQENLRNYTAPNTPAMRAVSQMDGFESPASAASVATDR